MLDINRVTGIEKRSAIGDANHPIVNQPKPPTIKQLNELFMEEGVKLSVGACKNALKEWGGDPQDITHLVSTTCTSSANPGYDHFVAKQLGISRNAEKILLAGIGCSGGIAAIRTAANIALGASYMRKPARVLVLACEVSSVFVRSELESIHENQEVRIGVCLFSDAASACVISNGIGERCTSSSIYDILGWKHEVIEDTHEDLGFDVDPLGWKVVLTQRVPSLTSKVVFPAFSSLMESVPEMQKDGAIPSPLDFDWALHPGGSLILTGVQSAMGIGEHQLRASYEIYMEHGNSSSATIMSVLDRLRQPRHEEGGKENVVACAFGPGINLELMALKRGVRSSDTPQSAEAPPLAETPSVEGDFANGVKVMPVQNFRHSTEMASATEMLPTESLD